MHQAGDNLSDFSLYITNIVRISIFNVRPDIFFFQMYRMETKWLTPQETETKDQTLHWTFTK